MDDRCGHIFGFVVEDIIPSLPGPDETRACSPHHLRGSVQSSLVPIQVLSMPVRPVRHQDFFLFAFTG